MKKIVNFFKATWGVIKLLGQVGSLICIFGAFLAGASYGAYKFLDKIWLPLITGENWE